MVVEGEVWSANIHRDFYENPPDVFVKPPCETTPNRGGFRKPSL